MFTSFWKKSAKNPNAVAISIGRPKGWDGQVAKELCPTWEMVKRGYEYEEYVEKILPKLNPYEVLARYNGKVMLCYESDRHHCHRGYLARWIKERTGIDVHELGEEPKPEPAQQELAF